MKIRTGFVSNSSTTSFIITLEDESLSKEELIEKSLTTLNGILEDDPEYFNELAERFAKENKYVLLKDRMEYGGEELLENIIPRLLKALSFDDSKVAIDWEY